MVLSNRKGGVMICLIVYIKYIYLISDRSFTQNKYAEFDFYCASISSCSSDNDFKFTAPGQNSWSVAGMH